MESILYHGSSRIVEHPSKQGGRVHNDFGQGFYCTADIGLAREWACSEAPSAFVNHYSFEPSYDLKVCDLSSPGFHVLNWLAVLLINRVFDTKQDAPAAIKDYIIREFLPDLSGFDVIRGYRADDSYFDYARSFLDGGLNLDQLRQAMRLGNLGEQIFLQSEKAFESLVFLTAEPVDKTVYLPQRGQRELRAREEFHQMKSGPKVFEGIFALDLYRNKIKNDDARLR